MEFDALGKHCQQELCGQRDILPFECQFCKKSLCYKHKDANNHSCLTDEEFMSLGIRKADIELVTYSCNFSDCTKESHAKLPCPLCGQNFCLEHRNPELHSCSALPDPTKSKTMYTPEAAALLQARKDELSKKRTSQGSQNTRRSTKDEAMQRKIRLTRIKMRANNQGVLEDRRLYLEVHGVSPTTGDMETNLGPVYLCSDKHWTVGKLLDICAKLLKVANNNSTASDPKDKLYITKSASAPKRGKKTYILESKADHLPFSSELKDILEDGDVVVLHKGIE